MKEEIEENSEELIDPTEEIDNTISEMGDFGHLIAIILDYYTTKNEMDYEEDGEDWKKGTDYEKQKAIPETIDKAVEKAFLEKLKKFQGHE